MAFLIFLKNRDGDTGSLYRIAKNSSDLNSLNLSTNFYKFIEISDDNFNQVKNETKLVIGYNENLVNYMDFQVIYPNTKGKTGPQQFLEEIENYQKAIKQFLDSNPNHSKYLDFKNFNDVLESVKPNINNIQFPLNQSLVQYLEANNLTSYNILQIP